MRTYTSINVRSMECLDTHYAAVLIGVGTTTVNPYLAEEAIADRHRRGLFGELSLNDCLERYRKAVDDGLLKIMSKMGISIISSYRGGCNFEAVGLSRSMVAEFFPGMPSRISGIGMAGVEKKVLEAHARAFGTDIVALPVGGFYRYRRNGERHAYQAEMIHLLQTAVSTGSYSTYKRYAENVYRTDPVNLARPAGFPLGACIGFGRRSGIDHRHSPPVHHAGHVARRAECRGSRDAERCHEPHRCQVRQRRGWRRSRRDSSRTPTATIGIPRSSRSLSGRFGVTAEYLNQCREIEIKVAQGAKPGEGGQLPGFKVSVEIARLRHSTPGVMLISPPPHHDIYSIEDLAQLIYDLKQINPDAEVTVKLVARTGIGTIAAGVAKAGADTISGVGRPPVVRAPVRRHRSNSPACPGKWASAKSTSC